MKQGGKNKGDRSTLNGCRDEINRIDGEIISLIQRRLEVAVEIGRLKRGLGMDIMDPGREQEVLRRLSSKRQENLNPQAIRAIFSEIISAARSVQQVPIIAYLGPEGTFTHQAAISLYGRSASFRATESIEEVFEWVEKGMCQHGLVPIENSYEGSVNNTLDLLYKYDLKIGAEIFLRIRHYLLSRADHLEKVERLYSHPMALAQCLSWIKAHLAGIQIKEVASTALAAKMAAEEPEAASVGSRLSGLAYDLNILGENIEDHPDNVTRFLVIGKTQSKPTGKDKTSLLFLLKHVPGALYRAVGALSERNINISRIESRPMKTRNWEYLFFVDLEGHEQDESLKEALRGMEGHCIFMKRLGSYPTGGSPWD
ncbi:MAG: prephenate dehydratase [Desulfatiglandales bacterium]|nr:prephenate dehydratase [Desulfatiglandales bacterium]